MVATGQEIVREKNSSRSGKCQGILFWVRENKTDFNAIKDCKTELMPSKFGRNISGQMGAKDCCKRRLEAASIFEILHLFGRKI